MRRIPIVASLALLSLMQGTWAQDGPNPQGSESVARPRNTSAAPTANSDAPLPAIPSKLSPRVKEDAAPDVSFRADTNVVNVEVAVLDNNGNPIPNIPKQNFRILEDNVPQTITHYGTGQAPMTVAMVIEFSARYQSYWSTGWRQTLFAAYSFLQTLKPDDYLAVIAYDLRTDILCDFTNDRSRIEEALSRLRVPGFSESNMFDAVTDTADRMSKIEGRKAIILITSGIDTFSKLTYDKTRKSLQDSAVPVYPIGILQLAREMAEARGANTIDFLQGDNELRTFAKETGGQAFFPRFMQEMPNAFAAISQSLRNQYTLSYSPTNTAKDGKYRKLTVQLVNPATNEPLRVTDQKGKAMKYTIVAKAGYTAPRAVE
jgi:VWFA-related protein